MGRLWRPRFCFFVILTTGALVTGGTNSDSFAQAKPVPVSENREAVLCGGRAHPPDSYWMQRRRTGTGGSCAPLSEILPAACDARFVRGHKKFAALPNIKRFAKSQARWGRTSASKRSRNFARGSVPSGLIRISLTPIAAKRFR